MGLMAREIGKVIEAQVLAIGYKMFFSPRESLWFFRLPFSHRLPRLQMGKEGWRRMRWNRVEWKGGIIDS